MSDLLARVRDHESLSFGDKVSLVCRLGAPAIMAQVTSVAMQYIDASMVGSLGADSSASIGLVATTTWLFGSLCTFATAGFTIQVAQLIGAKKMKDARTVMHNAFYVVPLVAVMLMIIGIMISGRLPGWLGGSEQIQAEASGYFLVYVCSLVVAALNSLGGGMLSVSGNLRLPGILNSLMCLLDVVFNAIFIFGDMEFTLPVIGKISVSGAGLGVVGAALGTALAELVIMFAMNYFLWFRTPLLRKQSGEHHPFTPEYVAKAGKLALPIAFERIVVCGAMIATTRIVAPLGVVSIAANSFAVTAESLCYMPAHGISEAATTLVGQSIGAGRARLGWSFGKITLVLGMVLMALAGTLMFILAPWMMSLLTPDAAVRSLGTTVLRIEAFSEPLYGASIVATGILRGAGDTLVPSLLNLVSLWGVRLPISILLVGKYGLRGVWVAMATELCVRGVLYIIRCVARMGKCEKSG